MVAILSMASCLKSDPVKRQSTRIYLKNNPAKFHPDPIWNDGALAFLKRSPQQKQEEEQDE